MNSIDRAVQEMRELQQQDEREYQRTHPYPPFSGENKACPKCGGRDVRAEYQAVNMVWTPPIVSQSLAPEGGVEWMLRTCRDCDYAWPEMCKDAP